MILGRERERQMRVYIVGGKIHSFILRPPQQGNVRAAPGMSQGGGEMLHKSIWLQDGVEGLTRSASQGYLNPVRLRLDKV